jgi:hypothetical protein
MFGSRFFQFGIFVRSIGRSRPPRICILAK